MIAKIKEIIESYAAMVNPTEEQKQIAEIRIRTCMTCEFWAVNELGMNYCKLCGCLTKAKVFTPKGLEGCPRNKWRV